MTIRTTTDDTTIDIEIWKIAACKINCAVGYDNDDAPNWCVAFLRFNNAISASTFDK
jgi:hypothetical protein